MSVWCCSVPNYLVGLEYRREPSLVGKPLALLDTEEHVLDVSADAQASGVCYGMPARQARTRCPDLLIRDADLIRCQEEQGALVSAIADCGLTTEVYGWGEVYLDLHQVATTADSVRPILQDLGKQVRGVLGDSINATGGWDTGKFTARAAARCAKPNSMHLVDRQNEERFLKPLPLTLLPLPPNSMQELYRLGVTTLGLYARLPATEVWQRFGKVGKIAQLWAKGRDDRPVSANAIVLPQPTSIDFDPPTGSHTDVLERTLNCLRPPLLELESQLSGCRRLRLELKFDNDETRVIDCTFIEPVGDGRKLRDTLSHQFATLNWPAELTTLKFTLLETSELVTRQLTLFDMDQDRSPLLDLYYKLSRRHGSIFYRAQLVDERHPIAAQRVTLDDFSRVGLA